VGYGRVLKQLHALEVWSAEIKPMLSLISVVCPIGRVVIGLCLPVFLLK